MRHISAPTPDGEQCIYCGAKRDKRHGIDVGIGNTLSPGVQSTISRGWVLRSGKVDSDCPGKVLSER